ncbi:MAG: hypothetical protein NT013_28115 [Planctomycetia bacterium]|nr:hypothetical protein [Planctomycetia bacterium]
MSSITDAAVDLLMQMRELVHLDLGNTPITNEGLQRLLAAPKLSELMVNATKVSDEGLELLANDPRWNFLSIGVRQTAKGVENLQLLPNLSFFQVAADCFPDASFDVSQFPKLQTMAIIGNATIYVSLTTNLLTRIARFRQIESLTLGSFDHVESAGLVELSKLDRLTSIKFQSVPLTDEGLAQLANHSSLKQVALFRTQVTASGLAKFRAARPDVQIETDIR